MAEIKAGVKKRPNSRIERPGGPGLKTKPKTKLKSKPECDMTGTWGAEGNAGSGGSGGGGAK